MEDPDAEFREKFMQVVNDKKADAGKTSSLMKIEKRDRIMRCLQNPELEPNTKFRSRVRERKYRLLKESGEMFLGVPDETSGELIYRRAACVEEFWDIIHAAHVDNGHIGVVHTFNSIRGVYALLPRTLVSLYVKMCPVCAHMFTKKPPQAAAAGMANTIQNNSNASCAATSTSSASNGTLASAVSPIGSPPALVVMKPSAASTEDPAEEGGDGGDVGGGDGDDAVPMDEGGEREEGEEEEGNVVINSQPMQKIEVQAPTDNPAAETTVTSSLPLMTGSRSTCVVFSCHVCDMNFDKKLLYQRHIRAHREHTPRIPFASPYGKTPTSTAFSKKRPQPHHRNTTRSELRRSTVARGRQVIVDGDMGVEACQALMLAACRSDLSVVGVTCVSGSVVIEKACNNALQVLHICNRQDVQVYCGAERPLVRRTVQPVDNLPGPSWQSTMDNSEVKSEHAVSAMIRLLNEQPGKISIVCLGPLTNLALALRLDPNMSKKLKEVFILGGNIEGRGDGSVCAEQNFYRDPEAAFAVLEEIPNITLLPYEVCDRHKLSGDFFDSWVHLGTSRSEFLRGMGDEDWVKEGEQNGYIPSCAYAMALVADRSVALERRHVYATVELGGEWSRGLMVVDWARRLQHREANVHLVRSLDLGKLQSLLIAMVEDPEALEVYTV